MGRYIRFLRGNNLSDVLFIAAPAADMQPIEMGVEFRTEKLEELRGAIPTTIPERREALQESLYMGFLSYTEYNRIEKEFFMAMEKRRREISAVQKAVKDEENRLKEIIAEGIRRPLSISDRVATP